MKVTINKKWYKSWYFYQAVFNSVVFGSLFWHRAVLGKCLVLLLVLPIFSLALFNDKNQIKEDKKVLLVALLTLLVSVLFVWLML